jgi:hypothetical protein
MPDLFEAVGVLSRVRCWCGIQHAVPKSSRDEQLRKFNDGKNPPSIYCPLGHQHSPAGVTDSEKLKRRLQQERAEHDQTKSYLRDAENSRRAQKAAKTRLKNRIANGVCPCCHRTFANLLRHMGEKHPDYSNT